MKSVAVRLTITFVMLLVVSGCATSPFADDAIPRMSKEDVKAKLGGPDLIILDTRTGSDWSDSDQKIQGARRADPKEFSKWAQVYPKNATIVLY